MASASSTSTSTPSENKLEIISVNNTFCHLDYARKSNIQLWKPKKSEMKYSNLFELLAEFWYSRESYEYLKGGTATKYQYVNRDGAYADIENQEHLEAALKQIPIVIEVKFGVAVYKDLQKKYNETLDNRTRPAKNLNKYLEVEEKAAEDKNGTPKIDKSLKPKDDGSRAGSSGGGGTSGTKASKKRAASTSPLKQVSNTKKPTKPAPQD